jgi:hypothetical protein
LKKLLMSLAVLAVVTGATCLRASEIPVATTSGVLAVHYDADSPSNASYYQLQFSSTNTNGAALSFITPTDKAIFGDVGQFGLDVIYTAPTNDGTVPKLTAVDYNGSGPVASAESITWAVNDYGQNVPVGPGNPSNIPYNSLFRGASIDISTSSLTHVGPNYTFTITGDLVSDGNINWYNPAAGTTSLASVGLANVFPFTATFTDNSVTDPGLRFFTGSGTIFAETLATPEPAAGVLLATGLASLIGVVYWRKREIRGRHPA